MAAPRRVLLVDDNEDSCDLYREYLQYEGHAVTIALDGVRALELLLAEAFDVVLMDIGLPGLDGYEVARRARDARGPELPLLIAVTGYAGVSHKDEALRAGFDLHLVKPIELDALAAAVVAAPVRATTT